MPRPPPKNMWSCWVILVIRTAGSLPSLKGVITAIRFPSLSPPPEVELERADTEDCTWGSHMAPTVGTPPEYRVLKLSERPIGCPLGVSASRNKPFVRSATQRKSLMFRLAATPLTTAKGRFCFKLRAAAQASSPQLSKPSEMSTTLTGLSPYRPFDVSSGRDRSVRANWS